MDASWPRQSYYPSICRKPKPGEAQEIRILDVICGAITLDEARIRGVPENWLKQAQLQSPIQPQLLQIESVAAPLLPKGMSSSLRTHDVILEIDGRLVTACTHLNVGPTTESVRVRVIREKQEQILLVSTTSSADIYTTYI